jgi:O-antigen/teichoic acid export membrane protein
VSNQLLYSLKWSALGEIASKVLPPLFYIITARLLTPEDFGVVATSAMVVAFASILWEAGLSKALIQNQEHDNLQKMSNIVFYTNMVLSLLLYIILFFTSDAIASFFHDERVGDVLQISGLSLLIGSLMSVQTAILQKDFDFKKLFLSRFVGAIIPGVVSVAFAYYGYGYWALVIGTIASMILQAIILWNGSRWRPKYEYDYPVAKKMFHFSKWVLLSSLLSWFFVWGDIFVLGFYFTSHELGLYRTGNYFVGAVIGVITAPIVPVMYSYFSKIQHDKEIVKKILLFSSKVVSFFVLPVGVGLYVVQNPLSDLIFGEKWLGIATVIGHLSLMHGVAWIVGLNNSAYLAIGRPDVDSKILTVNLFLYLIVYIISAQINFEFFILARFMLAAVSIFVHIYACKKILNLGFIETFNNIKYIIFVLISILFVNQLFLHRYISSIFSMFFVLLSSMTIYFITIFFLDKKFLLSLTNILKKRQK